MRVSGPVAFWRPVGGLRHGLSPVEVPRPGQERTTLCGETVTIVEVSEVEWFAPTCDDCWGWATSQRDGR